MPCSMSSLKSNYLLHQLFKQFRVKDNREHFSAHGGGFTIATTKKLRLNCLTDLEIKSRGS